MWFLVLSLHAAAGSPEPDPVLAVVEGLKIRQSEFEEAASRVAPAAGNTLSSTEKREVLDRLVSERILYLEALRQGLDRDPKVMKVMVNTLLRQDVYATITNDQFSAEQLEAYFNAHLDEFVVPEKVQIRRILLTTKSQTAAQAQKHAEALRRQLLADPDSFSELATRHSEDPYRRRGGDVGFVSREGKPGLDPVVVERAFALPEGTVSEVFTTDDGYNLVMVANRREAVERSFAQMQGSVLRKVKNDRLQVLYDEYVEQKRGGVSVQVDSAALDALEVETSRRPIPPGEGPGALGDPEAETDGSLIGGE